MCFLIIRGKNRLARGGLEYIENYRKMYRKIIRDTKKKENKRYMFNADNKTKSVH